MCLTSSSRDHQVMSSGDTAVVPSSIPNSDTKVPPTSNDTSEQDITKSSSLQSPDKTEKSNLPNSISDYDLHEQSMIPSSSNTSLENMAPGIIASSIRAMGEEVGELKREHAQSAFEITSFRPATDELDKSVTGRPTSTDSLTLHTVPEKGESDESLATPTSKPRLTDTVSESSLHKNSKANLADMEAAATEQLDVDKEVSPSNAVPSSPMTALVDESASKPSTHPPGGKAAQPVNGAGVQPNRFRRVNQYERGRWTIRDTLVTEEAAEGIPSHEKHQAQNQHQQLLPSEGMHSRQTSLPKHQDSGEPSNGTMKSTQHHPELTSASSEPPQLQVPVELIGITGGGLAPESASDKDSSSVHMDRSSTAAETLSRNTSMSSILAPEKSVDGDELLRDLDIDSMSGNQNDQDTGSDVPNASPLPPVVTQPQPLLLTQSPLLTHPTQPPAITTVSVGAVPPPSTTVVPRDEQQDTNSAPALENVEDRRARVENAMSFLQNELKEVLTNTVLTSSSYPSLIEENRVLKDEWTLIHQENHKLESELRSTKEDLLATRDENIRLKKELKELRYSLTRLAEVPKTSTGGNGSGTSSTQPAPVEDVTPAPPTSDDTSNSSQDVAT